MANAFEALTHTGIRRLTPYQPGKSSDELKRELGLNDIIKLASNENPLGYSNTVRPAINQALKEIDIYPDSGCFELKQALANHLSVLTNQLTVSNGSDSLIPLILKVFCLNQDKKVMFPQYSFISYKIQTQTLGIASIEVPSPNWTVDIDTIIEKLDDSIGVLFIANPNNPTGNWLTHAQICRLAKHCPPTTILVLDEAYYEYAPTNDFPDSLSLQQQYPNIIISRTFSKAYGLAGLRVGYTIANTDCADLLNRVLPPFSVNNLAQKAAIAAIGDQEFVKKSIDLNLEGIKLYEDYFHQHNINFIPTTTNFITMNCGEHSKACFNFLLSKGIIVRPLHAYDMPNHLRITIGLPQQNQRVCDALTSWRNQ